VEHATRNGQLLSVTVLDLDHFKQVNDTLGHAAGDHVLVAIASRLVEGMPLDRCGRALRQRRIRGVIPADRTRCGGGACRGFARAGRCHQQIQISIPAGEAHTKIVCGHTLHRLFVFLNTRCSAAVNSSAVNSHERSSACSGEGIPWHRCP
jgi:hypothetical protein